MMSTPEATTEKKRGLVKSREGRVVSNKMNQTVTVAVERMFQHPRYKKYVRHTNKLVAHDATNECNIGDVVRVVETRPLSKTKRWRVAEVIRRAE